MLNTWHQLLLKRLNCVEFLRDHNLNCQWPDATPNWNWLKLGQKNYSTDYLKMMIERYNQASTIAQIDYQKDLIDVVVDPKFLVRLRLVYLDSKFKRRFASLLLNDGVEFKTIGQSLLSGSFTLLHLESGQYFPFEVPGKHLIIKWKHAYE